MADADGHIEIDIDDLTIDEVILFEEQTGCPIDELGAAGRMKGPMLRALAFIAERRKNPTVTLEEIGRLKISVATGVPSSPLDSNGAAT